MNNKILIIIFAVLTLSLTGLLLIYNKNSNSSLTDNTIKVENSNVDWNTVDEKSTTDSENGIIITESGTYTLSGEINGQVVINTKGNVKLVLDDVTINSNNGPCILVSNAGNVLIYLTERTTNTLTDSTNYSGFEDEQGTIFSHDNLTLDGEGTLTINANCEDGIVSKDDLTINNGTYIINSKDDGIRGKDSVYIKDGEFTINAGGDGIKSSNDTDTEKGYVLIEGGTFNITAKSDGIQAITKLLISGGNINITSSEGLEATYVIINDGTIKISASDDGINASKKSTVMTPTIEINGGDITVNMGQGDTDALDANGNFYINGGKLNITAQSPFDYDLDGKLNGGEVIVNGSIVTQLTNQMMGPGGQGGPQGGGPQGGYGRR